MMSTGHKQVPKTRVTRLKPRQTALINTCWAACSYGGCWVSESQEKGRWAMKNIYPDPWVCDSRGHISSWPLPRKCFSSWGKSPTYSNPNQWRKHWGSPWRDREKTLPRPSTHDGGTKDQRSWDDHWGHRVLNEGSWVLLLLDHSPGGYGTQVFWSVS